MAESITYRVTGMRVTRPSEKVATANPDRAFTVNGTEWATVGTDGKLNKLSINSKNIDKETANSPLFAIDLKKGTLTVPEGRRGRTASAGLSAEELDSFLSELRGENS